MAENKVIAGYMKGEAVRLEANDIMIGSRRFAKWNINSYDVLSDESRKSILSGVIRGAAGKILLGPVGLAAGVLTAKTIRTYTISVMWKDGTKSLIETDDRIYKAMLKAAY